MAFIIAQNCLLSFGAPAKVLYPSGRCVLRVVVHALSYAFAESWLVMPSLSTVTVKSAAP